MDRRFPGEERTTFPLLSAPPPPSPRPRSCSVEALKTLMRSAGYSDHVSYVQKLQGWELLTSPERHREGVALLGR